MLSSRKQDNNSVITKYNISTSMLFRRVPTLYIVSIYYAILCIGT